MEARSLDELARLAADATPGPWRYPSGGAVVDALGQAVVFGELRPADAAYIAAANPLVVLALIERVRAAELSRDQQERFKWAANERADAAEHLLREREAIDGDAHDDEAAARWTAARIDGGVGQ